MNFGRRECMYGEKCYRLQPDHFSTYSHHHLETFAKTLDDHIVIPSSYTPKITKERLISQIKIIKKKMQAPSTSQSNDSGIASSTLSQSTSVGSGETSTSAKGGETSSAVGVVSTLAQGGEKCNARCKRENEDRGSDDSKRPKRDDAFGINQKLEFSEPYRFFISAITSKPETQNEKLALTFQDLLCEDLGEIVASLQFSFLVDLSWLIDQYSIQKIGGKPMTLIYGIGCDILDRPNFNEIYPQISAEQVKLRPFGCHHTKMMVMSYANNSIRLIITTGNLVESDWQNRVQGIWISPELPAITDPDEDFNYDSPTGFKSDLLRYLKSYKIDIIDPWIDKIEKIDFRAVKVFFISSVPGSYERQEHWGHAYLKTLLREHVYMDESPKDCTLICQCSSFGILGPNPSAWLQDDFCKSLSACQNFVSCCQNPKLLYPSFDNVKSSMEGKNGGACLPYSTHSHRKQLWINQFLNQWKSGIRSRTDVVPHIKTYCLMYPSNEHIAWFVLTSANMSKAAWGKTTAKDRLSMSSYEVGVLFLPQFLIGKNKFCINSEKKEDDPVFPMLYDVPVTPYGSGDQPWLFDMHFK